MASLQGSKCKFLQFFNFNHRHLKNFCGFYDGHILLSSVRRTRSPGLSVSQWPVWGTLCNQLRYYQLHQMQGFGHPTIMKQANVPRLCEWMCLFFFYPEAWLLFEGAGGLIAGRLMRMLKVSVVFKWPVLVIFCPHPSQSLPPANDLRETETRWVLWMDPIPCGTRKSVFLIQSKSMFLCRRFEIWTHRPVSEQLWRLLTHTHSA